jgi:hypothetical protein
VVLSLIELLGESNAAQCSRPSRVRVIFDGFTRLYGLIRINLRSADRTFAINKKTGD